jgi:hypothetical protein
MLSCCCVCFESDIERPVVLECGHVYHDYCIVEWLVAGTTSSCPCCRRSIRKTGIVPGEVSTPPPLTLASYGVRETADAFHVVLRPSPSPAHVGSAHRG